MSLNINALNELCNIFYPRFRIFPHTDPAALMGTGCTPAFGRAGGLWQLWTEVFTAGGVPLAMSLLAFACSERSAPCASPGKKLRQGVWRAHTHIG